MRNFVKIFLSIFLSVFLLSSCIWKNPWEGQIWVTGDVSESGKAIELPGENANFVLKINWKNADFLFSQYKKLLSIYSSWEEDEKEAKKAKDIIDKFKNSSLEFVLLTDGFIKSYYNNEAVSILFSNLDKDIISFAKDIKLGLAEKDIKDAKEMYEILNKKETLAEILASWKDIWKSLKKQKKQATDFSKENLEQIVKIINSMEIWAKNILVSVPAFNNPDSKLTWKLKNNKWFVELVKNLKWNELLYTYISGNDLELIEDSDQIDLKPKNMLIWASIEKTGINVNIYIKTDSKITEEQSKKIEEKIKELAPSIKSYFILWIPQVDDIVENKEDKEFVKSAMDSLNVKYTKLSEDIFSVNISLTTTDLGRAISITEKAVKKYREETKKVREDYYKKSQEDFENNDSEMSDWEDDFDEWDTKGFLEDAF